MDDFLFPSGWIVKTLNFTHTVRSKFVHYTSAKTRTFSLCCNFYAYGWTLYVLLRFKNTCLGWGKHHCLALNTWFGIIFALKNRNLKLEIFADALWKYPMLWLEWRLAALLGCYSAIVFPSTSWCATFGANADLGSICGVLKCFAGDCFCKLCSKRGALCWFLVSLMCRLVFVHNEH